MKPADHYCPDCDRRFSSHAGLRQHNDAVHRGLRPGPRPGACPVCGEMHVSQRALSDHRITAHAPRGSLHGDCIVCGASPTVADTELCGPCCFGTADAL